MHLYFRVLKYIKPYWGSLIGSVFCILFFTIFNLIFQVSIIPFLNTIFRSPDNRSVQAQSSNIEAAVPSQLEEYKRQALDTIYQFFQGDDPSIALERICILILFITLFKNLFAYLQAYLMAHVEQSVIRDIRNDLYKNIIYQPLSYFNKTRTGQIISRVTNDVTLINNGISASFVTLLKNPLMIMASLTAALVISWQLTLISLVVAPFSLGVISWIGMKLRKQSTLSQEKMADVTSVLQETITGSRIVKAFSMEHFEINKFMKETHEFYKRLLKITRIRNLASPLTEFLGTGVAVGILWFGGQRVLQGDIMSPEVFIGFLVIILSMMAPVKELSSVNNRIQEALAAAKRIYSVLDLHSNIQNSDNPIFLSNFSDSIQFKNVTFGYKDHINVLQNIDIKVTKGQIVALVGPSGAGKSTLVDLIPRFYDPQVGNIFIDNINIKNIDINNLRSLMGIVTQETILFNDTVLNNIAYGKHDIEKEKVIEGANIANAHSFITQLPEQYQTNIGERGIQLSGGQRQRIAIARAILKNPPILILDEATSALDTESERLVQEALERLMKNRTSFVIAHRLSTVINADWIIVLDKGQIIQQGQHQDLVAKEGLYQKLYKMQFKPQTSNQMV